VYTWGANLYGELGDGTTTMDFVYIAVGFAVLGVFVLYAIGLRRV